MSFEEGGEVKKSQHERERELCVCLFGDACDYEQLPQWTFNTPREILHVEKGMNCAPSNARAAVYCFKPFAGKVTFPLGLSKLTVDAIIDGAGDINTGRFAGPFMINQRRLSHVIDFRKERIGGVVEVAVKKDAEIVDNAGYYYILGIVSLQSNLPTGVVYYHKPSGTPVDDTIADLKRNSRIPVRI